MNVLVTGQKWFGAEVFQALRALAGIRVMHVFAPADDRLRAAADRAGVPVSLAGTLCEASMPAQVDLIVAAHSHDFIGERTRLRATYGGIGYHPSLLPLHRGRDAVKWAVRMRERVTGGTVYRLSQQVDGGPILAQHHVLIRPDDSAEELWRRDLAPLGVRLLAETVALIAREGHIPGTAQDEELATWEPSLDTRPLHRPDLLMIGHNRPTPARRSARPIAEPPAASQPMSPEPIVLEPVFREPIARERVSLSVGAGAEALPAAVPDRVPAYDAMRQPALSDGAR
ncbi:formyltransferase family protein [Roseateles amylovorans]|uniref:Formyltransferase family protein n=1 Tax=Roseateles amylovorans TaxID=2978473 RepID=A0ABY6ASA8_9BURK|nr:formyltransferase family protein [Roseateles amylovorans]UXH76109.1 formyltransferase family protein [Roseateles amylovorans]